MNSVTIGKIFDQCATYWSISVKQVQQDYDNALFTITELAPNKFQISRRSQPDFVIIIEDEP